MFYAHSSQQSLVGLLDTDCPVSYLHLNSNWASGYVISIVILYSGTSCTSYHFTTISSSLSAYLYDAQANEINT